MTNRKVSLVVGGGGIKSMAALGLYRVLQREGIEVNRLVGCSGGSFVCMLIALGVPSDEAIAVMQKFWTREAVTQFSYRSIPQALFSRFLGFPSNFALFKDHLIIKALNDYLGQTTFAQTQIKMHLVATDMITGNRVVISEGSIASAIRASMAIPVIFGPAEINGRWLVDGGCVDPLPIDVAIQEGSDLIIAMGFESPYATAINSFPNYLMQMISISLNNMMKSQIAFYNAVHHDEIITMMMNFEKPISLFDTHLMPYIIDSGETEAERHIPYIKRLLQRDEQPA